MAGGSVVTRRARTGPRSSCRTSCGGRHSAQEDAVGRTIEIDGLTRGSWHPRFDLMDKRVGVAAARRSAYRQYRESHFLGVLGRLKDR
jgi:hypothetical protein